MKSPFLLVAGGIGALNSVVVDALHLGINKGIPLPKKAKDLTTFGVSVGVSALSMYCLLRLGNVDIGVVNYGINNLQSVIKAFEKLGKKASWVETPEDVLKSKALVIPGVGAFASGMKGLIDKKLLDPIRERASAGAPILGICLGMQLLFSESDEFGVTEGINLIPGKVMSLKKRINNKIKSVKYDFDILKDRYVKIYNSLKDEKTETDNRIINIQTTLSGDANEFLVSPISGLIKDLRVFKIGDPVKINRTVTTIIPINNKINVIVDVDAKDIGYIKLGQKAIIDFNKGESRFYDKGNAKVSKIWTTSPKIYNKKVYYPVKLTLDSNFISIKNNIAMIALAQQIVSVRIITKQESLLKLIFNY